MNIVSLYKIWRGREFLVESIEANYHHVIGMVFVSSNISWTGKAGNNTKEIVLSWKEKNDHRDKIRVVDCDTTSQAIQYQKGVQHIREFFPNAQWMQIVDSDEVWSENAWAGTIACLHQHGRFAGTFACMMRSFMKTRDIVISESDRCVRPIVIVSAKLNYSGCRFNGLPAMLMDNVCVDHYGLVRDSWEDILMKIDTSKVGDGQGALVDIARWKREVWDPAPNGKCYHYYAGCESIWNGFRKREDG